MKPHARIRKTIKWGGAAVTALLVAAWIGSAWWDLEWGGPSHPNTPQLFGLAIEGEIALGRQVSPHNFLVEPGAYVERVSPRNSFQWWFGLERKPRWTMVFIPIWSLAASAAILTATAWRLDALARRRARAALNVCSKCGYDRAGIAANAKCPECGTHGPSTERATV
jgi:hypothetical protein